jgi:hypothetical protein
MESEGSLLLSQKPATSLHPVPEEFSADTQTITPSSILIL